MPLPWRIVHSVSEQEWLGSELGAVPRNPLIGTCSFAAFLAR